MIVLDTNVLSEMMRPSPSKRVLRWLAAQPSREVFTTTVTRAEILYAIEALPKGKRRSALRLAASTMFDEDFASRILPFDPEAARAFATIAAARRKLGRPITQHDAQIAAITRSRDAALATRNTADFADCGISVVNPWVER